MAFDAYRENGRPTYYDAEHTAWQADLITSGLLFCFATLTFCFYLILPATVGWGRLWYFMRVTTSLFIGAVILVAQFSMTWEVAETTARTKYKAGSGAEVNVTIGAMIGFKGVNITLKGEPGQIKGETIDYNENFSWEGLQGRLGFGPHAGRFNQEYRAAQFRGLPLPILWAAEYFTLDGEGIRWGRFYRQAGWYAHIMLWLAFPMWLMSNILFCVLLRFGAYFLAMTGLSMLMSNLIWSTLRNVNELEIPYTDVARLQFSYGSAFWFCLCTGIGCVVLSVVIFALDKTAPNIIAAFFNVDVLQDSEQILEEDEEIDSRAGSAKTANYGGGRNNSSADGEPSTSAMDAPDGREMEGEIYSNINDEDESDDNDDELYLPPPQFPQIPQSSRSPRQERQRAALIPPAHLMTRHSKRSYRSGENRMTMKFQKPRRRALPTESQRFHAGSPSAIINLDTIMVNNGAGEANSDSDDDNVYQNVRVVEALKLKSALPRS